MSRRCREAEENKRTQGIELSLNSLISTNGLQDDPKNMIL